MAGWRPGGAITQGRGLSRGSHLAVIPGGQGSLRIGASADRQAQERETHASTQGNRTVVPTSAVLSVGPLAYPAWAEKTVCRGTIEP